jgi:hypothetical protein
MYLIRIFSLLVLIACGLRPQAFAISRTAHLRNALTDFSLLPNAVPAEPVQLQRIDLLYKPAGEPLPYGLRPRGVRPHGKLVAGIVLTGIATMFLTFAVLLYADAAMNHPKNSTDDGGTLDKIFGTFCLMPALGMGIPGVYMIHKYRRAGKVHE